MVKLKKCSATRTLQLVYKCIKNMLNCFKFELFFSRPEKSLSLLLMKSKFLFQGKKRNTFVIKYTRETKKVNETLF